jgi:hypothetical protein
MRPARSDGIDLAVRRRHLDVGPKTLPKRILVKEFSRADRRSNFC